MEETTRKTKDSSTIVGQVKRTDPIMKGALRIVKPLPKDRCIIQKTDSLIQRKSTRV
jgi:hypothetical protein